MSPIDLDVHLPAIAAGDLEAFASWVAGAERSVRESLRPFAAALDTEAVVQETLLRIWQLAPRVEPDGRPNSLLRFAVRTARNFAVSVLRHARGPRVDPHVVERMLDRSEEVSPATVPDPLLRKAIEDCRDGLPEKPRRALSARLSSTGAERDEELAAREGMRLNTFLQNFTRARRLLADCLGAKGIAVEQYT